MKGTNTADSLYPSKIESSKGTLALPTGAIFHCAVAPGSGFLNRSTISSHVCIMSLSFRFNWDKFTTSSILSKVLSLPKND
jgi:hypothetical protein